MIKSGTYNRSFTETRMVYQKQNTVFLSKTLSILVNFNNFNNSYSEKQKTRSEPFTTGKITEKAAWRSVFLTIKHCMLNVDLTKSSLLRSYFLVLFAGWEVALKG